MGPLKTTSILQRVPVILAVTAASYGLPVQAQGHRSNPGSGPAPSRAAASALDHAVRETAAPHH